MAIIDTGLTTVGLKSAFFERLEQATTYYQDLATRVVSTTKKETYGWIGSVPRMREWGTGRLVRGIFAESYDVENLKYEITLEVDRDEISDDQTGQIRIRVQEMADRAAQHKDAMIGTLLINGTSSGYNSYDGVTFFNASHVSGESGAQDNTLAPSATDPNDPTVAEIRTALRSAIARILGFKDDQGEQIGGAATGLICVVPPSMYINMLEAINATLVASTTNVLQGAARVIGFPYITAAPTFYILKTDGVIRPFVFQDREAIEFTAQERDSDEGFLREKYLYGVRARYRITYGQWRNALKLTFA